MPHARNRVADALSRNNVTGFGLWCPQAQEQESAVPAELLDMLLLQEPNWTRRDWMEQWTSSVASPSELHKEDFCSSKESLYKILHCTHHINILPIIEQNLCHYMAFIAKEGMMANQVLSLSSAPPAHRGGVGHPKHGGYAETRVGDQRDKKSSGKDRSCSTRKPMTPKLLEKLRTMWQGKGRDGRMLWAVAASLRFLGFLRSGEITIPADSAYKSSTHDSFTDVADVERWTI